jgi:hypothetical protein
MEILADVTPPPTAALRRSHSPEPEPGAGHEAFRSCLRWEFGFHCAFCLLHEADLAPGGARRSGQMWIEHVEPQSIRRELASVYANCVYACRFCNHARGRQPVELAGVRLLDPCADAWAEHFEIVDDVLSARTENAAAERTRRAYRLDDPRKTELRRRRRELIHDRLRILRLSSKVPQLRGLLQHETDLQVRAELQRTLRDLNASVRQALRDLALFAAVPADRDDLCACGDGSACVLPDFVKRQSVEVAEEPGSR